VATESSVRREPAAPIKLADLPFVVRDLETRVKRLEWNAGLSLCLIVGSIVIGFGVFVLAGTIAANEQVSFYREVKAIEFNLTQNQTALDRVFTQVKETKDGNANFAEELAKIGARMEQLAGSLRLLESSLPDTLKDSEDANRRLLISSITTRVAAASLLAFLVVVLVNLYRYNVRLAAFYRARSDALRLADGHSPTVLEKIAKLLSPDKLDIDKMPESPTKQVIDLLKQVAVVARGKS
jgi:hypothetical protein